MSRPFGLPVPLPSKPDASGTGGRIATLDILRGLALLGMVLVHCHKMLAAVPASLTANPVGWLIMMGVAEKDRMIFAFLFGVSFAVMMRRIEAKGLPVGPIFMRRLVVLYLIGFAVEALTRFAILREYAWWGVALLFLRSLPTRTLIYVAVLSAAAFSIRDLVDSGYSIATEGLGATIAMDEARQEDWEKTLLAREELLTLSDYGAVTGTRVRLMLDDIFTLRRFTPNAYLALFIMGLLAVRHGIFSDPKRHQRLILGGMAAGLACWVIGWWLLPLVPPDFGTHRIAYHLRAGFGLVNEQFLAFTYIGAITLLLAYRPNGAKAFAVLGWVGRMALTNYLIQAAAIDFACSAYGFNLRLQPLEELLAAAILFGALALLSWFWLRRFRYGPVEWAWRSLTYWRWQPLRRPEAGLA